MYGRKHCNQRQNKTERILEKKNLNHLPKRLKTFKNKQRETKISPFVLKILQWRLRQQLQYLSTITKMRMRQKVEIKSEKQIIKEMKDKI